MEKLSVQWLRLNLVRGVALFAPRPGGRPSPGMLRPFGVLVATLGWELRRPDALDPQPQI